jgi:pyruvate formate lyase activating enzyme
VPEVLAEIEKDLVFYDESGGGVTFSGGEPLSQPLFLEALLDACAARRIHTVVDTCGFADKQLLGRLRGKVGTFLYDFKLFDAAKHKQYVGVPNDSILKNLEALAQGGSTVIIRFPVIPGVNDAPEDVGQMAEFLAGLHLLDIHLLPYHRLGIDKYERLGMGYRLPELEPPLPDCLQRIARQLERKGFVVTMGG